MTHSTWLESKARTAIALQPKLPRVSGCGTRGQPACRVPPGGGVFASGGECGPGGLLLAVAGSGHLWLAPSSIHQLLPALCLLACPACAFLFAFVRDPAVSHLVDYVGFSSLRVQVDTKDWASFPCAFCMPYQRGRCSSGTFSHEGQCQHCSPFLSAHIRVGVLAIRDLFRLLTMAIHMAIHILLRRFLNEFHAYT